MEKIAHHTTRKNTLEGIGNQHQHRSLGTDDTENVRRADILAAVITDINTVKGLHQPQAAGNRAADMTEHKAQQKM